jgi:hypothetical protein
MSNKVMRAAAVISAAPDKDLAPVRRLFATPGASPNLVRIILVVKTANPPIFDGGRCAMRTPTLPDPCPETKPRKETNNGRSGMP